MSKKRSKASRKQEAKNMKKKPPNVIPMRVPAIGGQPGVPGQQQIQLGPGDISFKPCVQCGGEFFDITYRNGILSNLNPKNPTGQDMSIKVEVLVCRECGWEMGKAVEVKQ